MNMTKARIRSIMTAINAMGLTATVYDSFLQYNPDTGIDEEQPNSIMVNTNYDGPYANKDTFDAIDKLRALCKRWHLHGETRGNYNGYLIREKSLNEVNKMHKTEMRAVKTDVKIKAISHKA